jgi:homoserine O-acetyltransferase/O-succinyltransferase
MVDAQYRLLSEGLGIRHVRLIIGNSMGGMNVWLWGAKYPNYMDALVPMAAQPTPMASRNWMLRRVMLETVRNDPEYKDGNYATQPHSMKIASIFFGIATAGGTLRYQKLAPTREEADKRVDARLAAALILLAVPRGVEPPTFGLGNRWSFSAWRCPGHESQTARRKRVYMGDARIAERL